MCSLALTAIRKLTSVNIRFLVDDATGDFYFLEVKCVVNNKIVYLLR
jgi:hypothetical protein